MYCFSNSSMPGIYKIGYTEHLPTKRLYEANSTMGTYSPPTPYTLEFAKRVDHAKEKEEEVFRRLNDYRINSRREFFRCSIECIRRTFECIKGEMWIDSPEPRWYQPNQAFEGHIYNHCSATIHGFRLNYIDREMFPPCRQGFECKCSTFPTMKWRLHLFEVHKGRKDTHNAKFTPIRPKPKPRRIRIKANP